LLSGDPRWTAACAHRTVDALPGLTPTWLTERQLAQGALPLSAASRLLGADLDLLLYDAHSGFEPDGFGAATGAIRGGGLLVLLTPALADWPHRSDPQANRIAVWPHSAGSLGGRFLGRLATVLVDARGLAHLAQGQVETLRATQVFMSEAARLNPLANDTDRTTERPDPTQPATLDQARAIATILGVARGRARRPLVIRAHRGRGKSAALGLAAGRLLHVAPLRILVTAPRRSAVESVFKHAGAVLTAPDSTAVSRCSPSQVGGMDRPAQWGGEGPLTFRSPAELAADRPPADLLLIDEAAGIPAPLLEALLLHYPRVVFATTVHGYEGTGRGFDVRFRATLDRLAPDWRALSLDTPIRWAPDDPLEDLTFRALLLDAAPATEEYLAGADLAHTPCERLDRDTLARDETAIRELFGLLVLAHYQTRPMDLRMLLDGLNVRVYALRRGGHIAAALVAAEEGGFTDPDLREAIFMGRRRPRGHLLPQTLSSHAGLAEATELRYLRVIRIAVHPALARRGIGRRLLRRLERDGRAEGLDLLGASFGATPGLVHFWDRCGFRAAQIGTSRNAASGEHALVMLCPLNRRGQRFAAKAEARLESRLPILLAGPLRGLDPMTATALAAAMRDAPGPSPDPSEQALQEHELGGFVHGHRSLDASLPLLADLIRRRLGPCLRARTIDAQGAALLIAAARQLRPTAELVKLCRAAGRDEVVAWLRQAAAQLRQP
jgi:tRNA(Met) cytidine acetyltransferase